MTAVDPSSDLLDLCAEAAIASGLDIELYQGEIDDLGGLCRGRTFDLVCCHGVMMYLDDWPRAIGALADRMTLGGRMSITFRNGHALAMRPGLRGDWVVALSAFHASGGLRPVGWYGVRVLTDAIAADAPPPDSETLTLLLDAEEQAGATEPYKWVASQVHVIAERAT